MQNGISKIVKSWRFLLTSWRFQPHYIDADGYNIRRYTPIQRGTKELLLSPRKVHPPVVRFGGKQDSLIGLRVFRGRADSNLNAPRRGGRGPFRRQIPTIKFYDFRGGRNECMNPKFVGIQWFLVTQMNITN